jgi:2'-phosphotransferase
MNIANIQLSHPKFRQYTLSQIEDVVDTNDKKRFTITALETPEGPKDFIRANQGHSIKTIQIEMTPITSAAEYPTIIHGTNHTAWQAILQDPKGLQRMKRNHIHFATGLLGEEGVISGMRYSCNVLVYLDLEKCLRERMKFFKSENGVVLTEGVDGEGYIPKEYFEKVVSSKGEKLWPL